MWYHHFYRSTYISLSRYALYTIECYHDLFLLEDVTKSAAVMQNERLGPIYIIKSLLDLPKALYPRN